jgi:hypothetical protein
MRKTKGLTLIKSPFMINSAIMITNFPNLDESILRKYYNVIPEKAGIQLSAFTFPDGTETLHFVPGFRRNDGSFPVYRSV